MMMRHNGFTKLITEEYVDGNRGRPRMEYISRIMKDTGIGSYHNFKDLSCDRET